MTDRPLRPVPEGFVNEVQVVSALLSAERENEGRLEILGASAALMVSDIPFHGN